MSGNYLIRRGLKKALSYLLILAMVFGCLGLGGMAEQVYASEAGIVAEESLIRALDYYKTKEYGKLSNWEELLAIYSTGKLPGQTLNLKEWKLPAIQATDGAASYTPAIITSLIRGSNPTALVDGLLSKLTGNKFSNYADAQAYAILGLEIARNSGIEISDTYSGKNAVEYLIGLQKPNGGFTGEYDGGYVTNDTTGIVALALAPYANEEGLKTQISAIVSFFEGEQLTEGGFKYYYAASQWGPAGSDESANSTALAVWGLSAIKSRTNDQELKDRIDIMLTKALPALIKWQNSDGSFGFEASGDGEFNSLTSRQIMIALYMIACNANIFDQIDRNAIELVDSHIRIESDLHNPVDVYISSEKNETIITSAETAWNKANMDGSFLPGEYNRYLLNNVLATTDTTITTTTNEIVIIAKDVTTRAAFENVSLTGEMNNPQTVTLINKESGEPLPGVIITIDGMNVGFGPVVTDSNGKVTIPADKFLVAGTYEISAASSGVSKDLCTIIINQGTQSTKYVSVRIEGINENIVNEKQIAVTTAGDRTLTAHDAMKKALDDKAIAYAVNSGQIASIADISDNYFSLVGKDYDYWNFYVNNQYSNYGVTSYVISDGDELLLFYGNANTVLPTVAYTIEEGNLTVELTATYYDWGADKYITTEVGGATVTLSREGVQLEALSTDASGIAVFSDMTTGTYLLKIEKFDITVEKEGMHLPAIVRSDHTIKIFEKTVIDSDVQTVDLTGISSSVPQSITVEAGATNPAIKVTKDSGAGLPEIAITSNSTNHVNMSIASGTKVSSDPNWDGTIALPTFTTVTLPDKTVSTAVYVGSNNYDITFDQPVRLHMPNVAGKKIGFIDASGDFTEITTTLTTDDVNAANDQLAAAGKTAGKYISGNDVIIWTKHFTTFVAYTDNTPPGGGGSNPGVKTVKITIKSASGTIASDSAYVITPGVDSILDVLEAVLHNAEIDITIGDNAYVLEIDGLGEFDGGVNSGWLCYVDKKGLNKSASAYKLQGGEVIEWIYTLDYTKEKGSEKWNQALLSEEITGTIAKEAMDSILKDIKAGKADRWTASLALGDISFDKDALAGLVDQMDGDSVNITIEQAFNKDLSAKQREAAGDRPVYDISITSGKKNISQFGGKLTIALPYKLKEGESPSGIVVYHLNADGDLVSMEGSYDPVSEKVIFTVDHLSYYVIGYDETLVKWPFTDVIQGDGANWFYSPVKFVYERGIFSGTGATTFSPGSPLTRSMLASVLARMSGADLTAYKAVPFADVDINSWYGPSVAWAKEMGIVSGYANKDGSFAFKPDDKISRQDIAVMLNNYNEKVGKTAYSQTASAVTFTDNPQIAEYAKVAVESMQQAGIIKGMKNADGSFRFNPTNNATRAEAATMIYNMLAGK